MSLLTDLQDDVLDSSRSLTTALRRTKILSFNLKNEQLRGWVESELLGYNDEASVPDYRRLDVQNRGDFMNTAWKLSNQLIPLSVIPEDLRTRLSEYIVIQSIPSLEADLEQGDGSYQIPWPPELAQFLSYKVYDNLGCTGAWKEFQRSQLVGIVETVRDRLLTIALELVDQVPELKNDNWEKRKDPRVQTIINSTILGGNNVVAFGDHATQTVSSSVQKGDIEALMAALQSLGLDLELDTELRKAIDDDNHEEREDGLGPHVLQVIGKIMTGSTRWASAASASLMAQAISSFYGLN